MWLKLALRNVLRSPRRTILSLVIIALGAGMLFAVNGFVRYMNGRLTLATIAQYGHLQIADADYWTDAEDRDETLVDPARVGQIAASLQAMPNVVGFAPQLALTCQIQKGSETGLLFAVGVEPRRRIIRSFQIIRGEDLQPDGTGTIVIGRLLADNLGVGPGDYVTLLIATVGGSFNTGRLRIVGVFSAFDEVFENQFAYVPIGTAQMLLNTAGVDKIVVRLSDDSQTDVAAAALRESLDASGTGLELRTWEELGTEHQQTKEMFNFIFSAVSLGIFVLVFFSILEVLTMSFMERTREVGTIRAIGTKRKHISRLFLTEGILLGLIGGFLGIFVGVGLGALVNGSGIAWTPPGAVNPVPILVQLAPFGAVVPLLIAMLSTLVSAVFPALHASRLQVVEALRSA